MLKAFVPKKSRTLRALLAIPKTRVKFRPRSGSRIPGISDPLASGIIEEANSPLCECRQKKFDGNWEIELG